MSRHSSYGLLPRHHRDRIRAAIHQERFHPSGHQQSSLYSQSLERGVALQIEDARRIDLVVDPFHCRRRLAQSIHFLKDSPEPLYSGISFALLA